MTSVGTIQELEVISYCELCNLHDEVEISSVELIP